MNKAVFGLQFPIALTGILALVAFLILSQSIFNFFFPGIFQADKDDFDSIINGFVEACSFGIGVSSKKINLGTNSIITLMEYDYTNWGGHPNSNLDISLNEDNKLKNNEVPLLRTTKVTDQDMARIRRLTTNYREIKIGEETFIVGTLKELNSCLREGSVVKPCLCLIDVKNEENKKFLINEVLKSEGTKRDNFNNYLSKKTVKSLLEGIEIISCKSLQFLSCFKTETSGSLTYYLPKNDFIISDGVNNFKIGLEIIENDIYLTALE